MFIALLALEPSIISAFTPISLIHYDDNVRGQNTLGTTIVVQAVQGDQDLEGCQPFRVELIMEWRSKAVEGIPDPIGGVIAEAMRNAAYAGDIAGVDSGIKNQFAFLDVEPEASGDRSNDKTSRHRLFKVPLLALLSVAIAQSQYLTPDNSGAYVQPDESLYLVPA